MVFKLSITMDYSNTPMQFTERGARELYDILAPHEFQLHLTPEVKGFITSLRQHLIGHIGISGSQQRYDDPMSDDWSHWRPEPSDIQPDDDPTEPAVARVYLEPPDGGPLPNPGSDPGADGPIHLELYNQYLHQGRLRNPRKPGHSSSGKSSYGPIQNTPSLITAMTKFPTQSKAQPSSTTRKPITERKGNGKARAQDRPTEPVVGTPDLHVWNPEKDITKRVKRNTNAVKRGDSCPRCRLMKYRVSGNSEYRHQHEERLIIVY
jgi:hypothetical protein